MILKAVLLFLTVFGATVGVLSYAESVRAPECPRGSAITEPVCFP
jgi:hypothetical protein